MGGIDMMKLQQFPTVNSDLDEKYGLPDTPSREQFGV